MLPYQRLRLSRLLAAALVALASVFPAVPAAANHEAPFDGSVHDYGEMVEYDLVFPVDGPVSFRDTFHSARGSGEHHAQDLMSAKMVPVVAAASGTVRYVNWSSNPDNLNENRCCTLVIHHDDGWETWYIHLNNDTPGTDDGQGWGIAPGIAVGVHVEAGDHIGWVGDSGNAEYTSPHLHFELYDEEGVLVNPYAALLAAQSGCTSDCYPFINLAIGSRGDSVVELQTMLQQAGFPPGPIDGIFGTLTRAAVLAFQTAHSLPATGVVDKTSWDALVAAAGNAPPPEPEPESQPESEAVIAQFGDRGSLVTDIQTRLANVGHSPGPIDGIYGSRTQAAVAAFQTASGLQASGKVTQGTWDALVAASEPAGGDASPPADEPPDTSTVVVDYGQRGALVMQLQSMLSRAGFSPGPIDGAYGPLTLAAVNGYQAAAGFEQSRQVVQAVWDALVEATKVDPVVARYGSRGPHVMEIQVLLAGSGFPPGPIDGIFGRLTKAAVTAFQVAAGVAATGEVTESLLEELKATAG